MDVIPAAVGLGAMVGALSRYYLTLVWVHKQGSWFPYGTCFVNLTGAFVIGFVATLAPNYGLPMAFQPFILTGFLGAYTTFSSYILDTANLFQGARSIIALLYWLGSPALGFICVEMGIWLGKHLL